MKWFKNLDTMTRLMAAFSVISAMLLAVGLVGVINIDGFDRQIDSLYKSDMRGVVSILEADAARLEVARCVGQAILEHSPASARALREQAETAQRTMTQRLDDAEKTLASDEARAKMKILRAIAPEWAAANRRVLELALADRDAEAIAVLDQNLARTQQLSQAAEGLRDYKLAQGQRAHDASERTATSARALMIALVSVGMLAALVLGFLIARTLAVPLREAVRVLGAVARGDFTERLIVDSKDEVGRMAESLNVAVESMRSALTQVSQAANNVTSASGELSSASQSISSGAQQQASSLEETAASLEEMTSAVKLNADNAQQAALLAQGAREVAEKGGVVVGSAVQAMSEINAASKKIADIITAIDEIAFQTNLLALNAAVEAARAGEQGRGFAVVAGEVRNLAQRSASAAKEIKGLIHDTVQKVEVGSRLVNQSGQTLDEIVTSVKRVTDIVSEIAASSREQSTGIEHVNTAVTQMDAVTQANASQTEELAGTADALSGQARQMMELVQRFELGHAAAPPATASEVRRKGVVAMPAGRRRASSVPRASAPVAAATGTDGGFEEF